MSDFHEVLFPTDISYGSSGGPKYKTAVWTADSGFEARVSDWTNVRAEYDVSMGVRSEAQAEALTNFFLNRRGRAYAFRFKDWNDYSVEDYALGIGDYATDQYQVQKTYRHETSTGEVFEMNRTLKKLEWGSERDVTIDGLALTKDPVDERYYAINYNTGLITYSEPPRGGLYAGTTLLTAVDPITTGEGGISTGQLRATISQAAFPYDAGRGWGFMLGVFPTGDGLRKYDVTTGAETLQRSAASINPDPALPLEDYSGIICVDGEGFVYLNTGGSSNGQPILKVDGANLSYVTHWGVRNNDLTGIETSHMAGRPGAVALNNETFLHIDLFGQVTLHATSTCAALRRVLDADNGNVTGACPYRDNGYAIGYNDIANPDNGCALHIIYPGHGFQTFAWGSPTARVTSCHYDRKTGGVLIFWENETGLVSPLDSWCGLWHENEGGFVWRRRMVQQHGRSRLNNMDSQAPLDGVLCWITQGAQYWGTRLWRLETETGLLQSRLCATYGRWIAYDPGRDIILGTDSPLGHFIASTDVTGVALAPPETLHLGKLEFHVGVRFDTDHLNMKHDFWTYRSWDSIPLVEVRNWDDLELD